MKHKNETESSEDQDSCMHEHIPNENSPLSATACTEVPTEEDEHSFLDSPQVTRKEDSDSYNGRVTSKTALLADSDVKSVSSEVIDTLEEAYEEVLECSHRALSEMRGASHKVMEEAQRVIDKLYYTFHELPDHMKDNDFIVTGYRAYYSAKQCFSSIFRVHNETMNIWTHMLGFFLYVAMLLISFNLAPLDSPISDKIILALFLFSAVQCLFFSSAFHTFCAHKRYRTYQKFQILDYCGISCLICGSFLTYLHYGFYNQLLWRIIYYSVLGVLWIFGYVLPCFPFFRSLKFRIWRAVYYVLMGVCLFILCCHAMIVNQALVFVGRIGWANLVLELSFYLVGAVIYASRYPERWFPGKLDIFFHSHQIWHVFILIASIFHIRGTFNLMEAYNKL